MEMSPDIQLPSLPEVTLRALEACQQESSYREISNIISADTALVARVLALANSSVYGQPGEIASVEQALLRLGTHRVHTLILTAALRQLLFELGADQWQQLRDFWRHSLTTALTARALATLTRYPSPDEAFMLGLLHNIGELIALKTPEGETRQQYLNQQAEIGAKLVLAWGLGPMAADAVRYQQAPPRDIRDASHLVKLINLSTRLALSDAAGIAAASTVFGLGEELTREINTRINNEVTALAESLGIPLERDYDASASSRKLRHTILRHAMANQAFGLTPTHGTSLDILAGAVASLTLLTGLPVLCFGTTGDTLSLLSSSLGNVPELSVSPVSPQSVLTRAFHDRAAVSLGDGKPSVLDRQLLSLMGAPSLLALPVNVGGVCIGAYVIGTEQGDSTSVEELAHLFASQLGQSLTARQPTLRSPETGRTSAGPTGGDDTIDGELARQALRRQVHEISNPLTIIRQYIYQLRNRLEDTRVQEELDVIREELDRAGSLLLQLGQDTTDQDNDSRCPLLNEELRLLKDLFEDSLFAGDSVELAVSLCDEPTGVTASRSVVRQIVINLVRNAVESINGEGRVALRTATPVWQNGQRWVELDIEDNGPGIAKPVQERLFQPVNSTKGAGHSGLGLSIVKQLVDDMEGIIGCRTGQSGTVFRVLFPATADNQDDD